MIRKKKELIDLLEKAEREAGEGKPIGIGSLFWADVWNSMSDDPDLVFNMSPDIWKTKILGTWRGHDLYCIPGNLLNKGMDEPRPWKVEE
jgi:hypothetical protein